MAAFCAVTMLLIKIYAVVLNELKVKLYDCYTFFMIRYEWLFDYSIEIDIDYDNYLLVYVYTL